MKRITKKEIHKILKDEWDKGGLRTMKDMEKFGESFSLFGWKPMKTKTVSNHLTDMRKLGIIEKSNYKRQNWTKQEDELLKEKTKEMTLGEVQKTFFPYRNIDSLNHRSRKLGLNLHQYSTTPWSKHWIEDEKRILMDGIEMGYTIRQISKMLPDRTFDGINKRLNTMGYHPQRLDDEEYIKGVPWKDDELDILKKWYPLVGSRISDRRIIIGTPSITEMLPNRTSVSIEIKSHKIGLLYEPQKNVQEGYERCVLCIEIKKYDYMVGHFSYCKKCQSKITKVWRTENKEKVIGKSLSDRYKMVTGKNVDTKHCVDIVSRVFEKYNNECCFKDEHCDDRHTTGVTLGHKNSVKGGGDILSENNLFLLCINHNSFMTDVNLSDLKNCVDSMINKLDHINVD
jgi:hypothetical protein